MSTLGNNLLAQYYAQNQGLPYGYEAVEYLESDTTNQQYIDTGIYANDNVGCEIVFQGFDNHLSTVIFGSRNDSGDTRFWLNTDYAAKRFYIGWGASYASVPITQQKHIVDMNYYNDRKVVIDGVSVRDLSETAPTQIYTAYLFTANNQGSLFPRYSVSRVFSYKSTDGQMIIRNFIPCIRKSDGKPGLYDLCRSICPLTGTPFYINAGTGEFVTP